MTPAAEGEGTPDAVRNDDLRAHVTAKVTGDQQFSWEGDTTIRVTRAGGLGRQVNVFSVGMVTPQQLDEPRDSFRWAFDMVSKFRDEPGSYELEPPGEGAQINDNVFVIFIRAKEGVALPPQTEADVYLFLEYVEVKQPCTLTVEDSRGEKGALTCPALATADGGTVSLEATWAATGDRAE